MRSGFVRSGKNFDVVNLDQASINSQLGLVRPFGALGFYIFYKNGGSTVAFAKRAVVNDMRVILLKSCRDSGGMPGSRDRISRTIT